MNGDEPLNLVALVQTAWERQATERYDALRWRGYRSASTHHLHSVLIAENVGLKHGGFFQPCIFGHVQF